MITTRPRRRESLWAEADGVHFSIPVTPHMFRHRATLCIYSIIASHGRLLRPWPDTRIRARWSIYTRVFALDMTATLAVPFTGNGHDAASASAHNMTTSLTTAYINCGE